MAHLTPDEVLAIIQAGDDGRLLGCYETESVDFKGEYRLTEQAQKWELAKDVAAFANSGGGIIVVGVLTRQDEDRAEDVVYEIRPIPRELFEPKQVRDTLREWVYPPPDVDIERYPRGDACLGTILVRPRDRDVPYLVTRIPDDRNRYSANTGVGWPYRGGTHTTWTPVGQIHAALQAPGPSVPPPEPPSPEPSPSPSDLVVATVKDIDAFMGWGDRAYVYLVANPEQPRGVLADFFADDGVLGAIRQPFELRWAGFGLTYGTTETDLEGRIVSADGDGRFLRVSPDGVMCAAASAGTSFLTRGGGHERIDDPGPASINPIVLTEWTYLFSRFAHTELIPRAKGVWNLSIGVHGARTRPWTLAMYSGGSADPRVFRHPRPAGHDSWHHSIAVSRTPEQDGYRLLQAIYEIFGQKYDATGLAQGGRINVETLAHLGGPPGG